MFALADDYFFNDDDVNNIGDFGAPPWIVSIDLEEVTTAGDQIRATDVITGWIRAFSFRVY